MVRGREPERLSRDDHSGYPGQRGRYRVGFRLRRGCFVDLDLEGLGFVLGPSSLSGLCGFGGVSNICFRAASRRRAASSSVYSS